MIVHPKFRGVFKKIFGKPPTCATRSTGIHFEGAKFWVSKIEIYLGLVSYRDPCLVSMFFLVLECRNAGCLPHLESMLGARRIIADMCGTGIGWFFQHSPLYHLAEGEECLSRTEGGIPKRGARKKTVWKTFSFLFGEGFLNASATFRECSLRRTLKDKPDNKSRIPMFHDLSQKKETHQSLGFSSEKNSPHGISGQGRSPLVLGAVIPWIVFAIGFKQLTPGVWKPGRKKTSGSTLLTGWGGSCFF